MPFAHSCAHSTSNSITPVFATRVCTVALWVLYATPADPPFSSSGSMRDVSECTKCLAVRACTPHAHTRVEDGVKVGWGHAMSCSGRVNICQATGRAWLTWHDPQIPLQPNQSTSCDAMLPTKGWCACSAHVLAYTHNHACGSFDQVLRTPSSEHAVIWYTKADCLGLLDTTEHMTPPRAFTYPQGGITTTIREYSPIYIICLLPYDAIFFTSIHQML